MTDERITADPTLTWDEAFDAVTDALERTPGAPARLARTALDALSREDRRLFGENCQRSLHAIVTAALNEELALAEGGY